MNLQQTQIWRQARREMATVLIDGVEEATARLCEILLGQQIGTLLLRGRGAGDLAKELRQSNSVTLVAEAPGRDDLSQVDVHVIFGGPQPCTSEELGAWRSALDQPHVLPVKVNAEGAWIGPAADPLTDQFRIAPDPTEPPPVTDSLILEVAAAVTAQQIQLLIEGIHVPEVLHSCLHISAATGHLISIAR